MEDAELKVNRLNTAAFINARPSRIVLIPQERVETPSGGYKMTDGLPRDAQTFRIIELGANQTPPVIRLTDGTQREASFWLLGNYNAEVAIDDHWTETDAATGNRRHWVVGDIVRANHYEVRGLVVERGK